MSSVFLLKNSERAFDEIPGSSSAGACHNLQPAWGNIQPACHNLQPFCQDSS